MAEDRKFSLASYVLAGLGLLLVIWLGLLPALLVGLLIYHIVQSLVPSLQRLGLPRNLSKVVVPAILAVLIVLAITFGIVRLVTFTTRGSDSLVGLLQQMAEAIESARIHMPAWASEYLPTDVDDMKIMASKWLRGHAGQFQEMGRHVGAFLFRTLIGMIVGGLVAIHVGPQRRPAGPLAQALVVRLKRLSEAFRSIVFSQIKISALNTTLTALYILAILPFFGIQMPLSTTLVAVTFLAGLLPILGNLISNTVIVVVSLSVSPELAIASLGFLVFIHKLEYFVNARIIGGQIRAHSWELLTAMLVMEAAFGISGLIAAPIYYAYLRAELTAERLL